VLVFVIGGIAFPKKSSPNLNAGTRAVIVPTADAARTVLVAPCGTGTDVSAEGAASLRDTTGTLALTLPQGSGTRVVLVPRCSSPTSNLPSAAFALKPGTPVPSTAKGPSTAIAAPGSAQSQLLVPVGSPVRTVVVAPCNSHSPTPAQRIVSGTGATATAPAC
jgi:hypothetical protein